MFRKGVIVLLLGSACLLTGLGLAGLWRDVYWRSRRGGETVVRLWADKGHLRARLSRRINATPRYQTGASLGRLGTFQYRSGGRGRWRYQEVMFPVWTMVAILLIHPAAALICGPMRRRRRRQRRQCVECGYNLAGNVTGRCPECGTTVDHQEPVETLSVPL